MIGKFSSDSVAVEIKSRPNLTHVCSPSPIKAMLIALSVKAAAGRRPASFALGSFDPSASGWTAGWSFFIGLLPVRGFDAL
jgi:hypothetical protein